MASSRTLSAVCGLLFAGLVPPAFSQSLGMPASDSMGHEDIWHNPTFRGGVVNGGANAHSEW
jgi:hypothetical protein